MIFFFINHLPPCRSKHVKALFVFRTKLVTEKYESFVRLQNKTCDWKVWKISSKKSICHKWFNLNVMKRREYFLYAKKIKITTLSIRHRSAILESILWMQIVYAVLWCGWHQKWVCGDADETNCWIKFSLCRKSIYNIQIEPLMADGLFWQCLSYFSGTWQC